jgi:uncharacterized membrane protein
MKYGTLQKKDRENKIGIETKFVLLSCLLHVDHVNNPRLTCAESALSFDIAVKRVKKRTGKAVIINGVASGAHYEKGVTRLGLAGRVICLTNIPSPVTR